MDSWGCFSMIGKIIVGLFIGFFVFGVLAVNLNVSPGLAFFIGFVLTPVFIVSLWTLSSRRNNRSGGSSYYTPRNTSSSHDDIMLHRERGQRMATLVMTGESCQTCSYNDDGSYGLCSFATTSKPVLQGTQICWKHAKK